VAIVWGERRDPPDWDLFIETLLAYASDEAERQAKDRKAD